MSNLNPNIDIDDEIRPSEADEENARPWPLPEIIVIVSFLILGVLSISLSMLISAHYFDGKYEDRVWPLFIVGILVIIPGAYYGYILICILFKREGFSLADIPSCH